MSMIKHRQLLLAVLAASAAGGALASSHREAPFISTTLPSVLGWHGDFYMFNSYESGRAGYVTLIANYVPLQDPQGGPNYFALDDNALYEISVDNTGSGKANLTFQFRFTHHDSRRPHGPCGYEIRSRAPDQHRPRQRREHRRSKRRADLYADAGQGRSAHRRYHVMPITNTTSGSATFAKPLDNIGAKSIANYAAYAGSFVYPISIPGCSGQGKVFVGQRQDPFFLESGRHLRSWSQPGGYPVGRTVGSRRRMSTRNYWYQFAGARFNVTSLALEISNARPRV